MKSKNNRDRCALQPIRALCWNHGLPAPSNAQSVHILIKDSLAVLGSSRNWAESFVEHKRMSEAKKYKLKPFVEASESKLSVALQCVQKL